MRLKRTIPTLVAALALMVTAASPALAAESIDGSTPQAAWAGSPHPGVGVIHTAVAGLLGMSVDDLETARHGGQSLAEIATEKGVDTQTLIGTILQARQGSIDEAVEAGTLTQERADAMMERMTERVSERVVDPAVGPRGSQGADGEAGTFGGRGQGQGMGRGAAGSLGTCIVAPPAA